MRLPLTAGSRRPRPRRPASSPAPSTYVIGPSKTSRRSSASRRPAGPSASSGHGGRPARAQPCPARPRRQRPAPSRSAASRASPTTRPYRPRFGRDPDFVALRTASATWTWLARAPLRPHLHAARWGCRRPCPEPHRRQAAPATRPLRPCPHREPPASHRQCHRASTTSRCHPASAASVASSSGTRGASPAGLHLEDGRRGRSSGRPAYRVNLRVRQGASRLSSAREGTWWHGMSNGSWRAALQNSITDISCLSAPHSGRPISSNGLRLARASAYSM